MRGNHTLPLRSEADQYVVEGEVVIHASLASLVALGVALPVSVADLRPQDLRSGRNLRTDYLADYRRDEQRSVCKLDKGRVSAP